VKEMKTFLGAITFITLIGFLRTTLLFTGIFFILLITVMLFFVV
jgi:hypothetical protein